MTAPPAATLTPQHLSPRVLAIHPLRSLRAFALPLLGVLVLGRFSADSLLYAGIGLLVAFVLPMLRWAAYTYAVREDRLEIRQGLLARHTRAIPLDRIRGVDVSAPVLHRMLGLAVVHVEAAAGGEEKDEGVLDAVTTAEAERLRSLLLRRREVRADAEAPSMPRPQVEYARLRSRWCLYAPLTASYLLAPLALLASLAGFAVEAATQVGEVDEEQLRRVVEFVLGAPQIAVPAVVGLLLAVPGLSVVAFAVLNWDFRLRARDGTLVTERGLFTRRTVSLERRRVRGWELTEGLLERVPRVARLQAIITGLAGETTRAQLLPLAPRAEALSVAGRAVFGFRAPLARHPAAARTRRLARSCLPWALAGAVAYVLLSWWLAAAFLALAAVGVPLGLDRYRSLGHAVDAGRVAVRGGSLRRRQAVVESRAIVGWRIRQTWFQRRVGLLTVVVGVGAGRGGYTAVDLGEQQAVDLVATTTPRWVRPLLSTSVPPPPAPPGS